MEAGRCAEVMDLDTEGWVTPSLLTLRLRYEAVNFRQQSGSMRAAAEPRRADGRGAYVMLRIDGHKSH